MGVHARESERTDMCFDGAGSRQKYKGASWFSYLKLENEIES